MKTNYFKYFMYMLLIVSVSFTSCSEDEDDNPQPSASGKIPGLTASLSTDNGKSIYLSFNDAAGDEVSSLDGYDIYQSENGGEFERIVGYATSKTYRTVIKRALEVYGEGVVLPRDPKMRSLTEHFRATNLQELTDYLNDELSV